MKNNRHYYIEIEIEIIFVIVERDLLLLRCCFSVVRCKMLNVKCQIIYLSCYSFPLRIPLFAWNVYWSIETRM